MNGFASPARLRPLDGQHEVNFRSYCNGFHVNLTVITRILTYFEVK